MTADDTARETREPDEWMSTAQALAYLGVSRTTLWRAVRDEELIAGGTAGLRRFKRSELDHYLATRGGRQ